MKNTVTKLALANDECIYAEQSVLGSVFLESSAMDNINALLVPEDFLILTHQTIWKAMQWLYNKNQPVDLITVTDILKRGKKLDEVGGITYLSELSNSIPTASNVEYYAKIVKRYSDKRKGLELAENIKTLTEEDDFETSEEYYALIDSLVSRLRPNTTGKMRSFAETEDEYFEYLTSKTDNIKTGFGQFDEWSGGIGRGWLYILAGRPSIGKTAKALQMAYSMARQNVGDILIWSQEMTFNQLKNRIISNMSGVNYSRIRRKQVDEYEISKIRKAHQEVNQLPLYVEDSYGVNIEHIRATARQIYRKNGQLGAIFVDYLTRMDIKQEKGQTWSRAVGEVAKRFKWLAQEMNCPVILLAQLSREGADGEPQLHHLRDSGEVEQEADVVEFLWEDKDEISKDGIVVQSTIAKGRDIGVGKFKYLFRGYCQRYEDYKG